MDPYYFLDMNFKLKDDNDDEFEPQEILDMFPDGTWGLNCGNYGFVTFRGKEYTEIFYSKRHNVLACKNNEGLDRYRISVELMDEGVGE